MTIIPNPTDPSSLQGTMTGGQPTQPQQVLPTPGTVPSGIFSQPTAASPFQFSSFLQTAVDRLNTINPLIQQKNLLVKHLYGGGLTDQEKSQLPQELQNTVNTGSKDETEMALRIINDGISGKANTLNQSLQFLTSAYEKSIADAEAQRKDAENTVKAFVTAYGSQAKSALKSVYGTQKVSQLEQLGGMDLGAIGSLPETIAERKLSQTLGAVASDQVDSAAQALIDGRLAPSQLPGFGQNSLKAKAIGRALEIDPNWNAANAEQQFSFGKATRTQQIEASIQSALNAQQIIKNLSHQVKRGDIQPINALQLQFASRTGDTKTAQFLSAVKVLGDEYGVIFGQGAASDFKAKLGLALTDPSLSQAQFDAVVDSTLELMRARADAIYGQAGKTSPISNDTLGIDSNNTNPLNLGF